MVNYLSDNDQDVVKLETRLEADIAAYADRLREPEKSEIVNSRSSAFQEIHNEIRSISQTQDSLEKAKPILNEIGDQYKHLIVLEQDQIKDEAERHAAAIAENRPIEPEAAALHAPYEATADLENPDTDYEVPDMDFIVEHTFQEKIELTRMSIHEMAEDAFKNPDTAKVLEKAGFKDANHLSDQVDKVHIDSEIGMGFARMEQELKDRSSNLERKLQEFSQDFDRNGKTIPEFIAVLQKDPKEANRELEAIVSSSSPLVTEAHKATEAVLNLDEKTKWLEQTTELEKSVRLISALDEKLREFSGHLNDSEYRHIERLEGPAKDQAVKVVEKAKAAAFAAIDKAYNDPAAAVILSTRSDTIHRGKAISTGQEAKDLIEAGQIGRVTLPVGNAKEVAEKTLEKRQNELPERAKEAREALENARAATYSLRDKVLAQEMLSVRSNAQEDIQFTQKTIQRLESEVTADQSKIEKLSQAGAVQKAVAYVTGKPISGQIEAAQERVSSNSGTLVMAEVRLGELHQTLAEPNRANDNRELSLAEREALARLQLRQGNQSQGQSVEVSAQEVGQLRAAVISGTKPIREAEQTIGKAVELSQARERTQMLGRIRANDQSLGQGR